MFVAWCVIAFGGKTYKVFFLPDKSFAFVSKNAIRVYSFNGNELPVIWQSVRSVFLPTDKGDYEHFMLKEMYEQKNVIIKTVELLHVLEPSLFEQLGLSLAIVQNLQKICFVACGTSWHAARIAQFFFETIAHVPVAVYVASEFRYMEFFP